MGKYRKIKLIIGKFLARGFRNSRFSFFEIPLPGIYFSFLKKSLSLLISDFFSQILENHFSLFLKTLEFFSDFFIIFPKKGDRFPVVCATHHFHTIFIGLYMDFWKYSGPLYTTHPGTKFMWSMKTEGYSHYQENIFNRTNHDRNQNIFVEP